MRRGMRWTITAGALISLAFAVWALAHLRHSTDKIASANQIVQTIAIFGTACWFALRAWLGYFYSSLKVRLAVDRIRKDALDDFLSATLTIESGRDGGVLELHDVLFEASTDEVVFSRSRPSSQFDRRLVRRDDDGRIRIDSHDADRAPLNIGPGDSMQFAFCASVKQRVPCVVHAYVVTRGAGGTRYPGQWRASAVSLPRENG